MLAVPERNALIVPLKDLAGIDPLIFRKFKVVEFEDQKQMVLPFDIETCGILRRRGIDTVGPINYDYDWPMSSPDFSPFAHQKVTADFLTQHERCFVFNEIGVGKTLSALWAADYLMRKGLVKRVLIASTLSTLWRVWDDEIFKSFPKRSATILHGSRAQRAKRLAEEHDFYIVNHEGVEIIANDLIDRDDIDLIILDEGARYRNKQTNMYRALEAVAGTQSKRKLWWMTGSPMPKAPTDIWAQARLVNPTSVPRTFTRFRELVMRQISQYTWVPKQGWEETVFSMVHPCIRFKRDECIDIDREIVEQREVPMSKLQSTAYATMKKSMVIEAHEKTITAVNEGVKLGKLLQVATGAVYDGQGEVIELAPKSKLEELVSLIEEVGNKAIVFAPFKHSLRMIKEYLFSKDLSVGMVSGDVSASKRSTIFQEFQDGDLQVLLAHPETMAHGLTLTASRAAIWFAPIDDFEIYEQANGRITRPGQKFTPLIIHLICSEIERRVYDRLQTKERMQGLLLQLLNQ